MYINKSHPVKVALCCFIVKDPLLTINGLFHKELLQRKGIAASIVLKSKQFIDCSMI